MVLPPDHADRVIATHRARVEKVAMLGTLVLIGSAFWWLLPAIDGSVEMLPRLGPVLGIFAAGLLLMDLIDHGPVERARLAVIACIAWPLSLAMAVDSAGSGDRALAAALLLGVAAVLLLYSREALSVSLPSRRLRGFGGLAGAALAAAVLASLGTELTMAGAVVVAAVLPVIPDLTAKDDDHEARQEFGVTLEAAEAEMLTLRSKNSGLEQAASLIKQAREEGWKKPARGMVLIEEAEREAERIMAMAIDINAIRADSLAAVERSEAVAVAAVGPRKAFQMGDREAGHGSLREAEMLFRLAKTKAATIEEHWQAAVDSISAAEAAISEHSGAAADSVRGILAAAHEALDAEQPAEALHIASSIPAHIESLAASAGDAKSAITDAELAISAAEGELALRNADRLTEAKEAMAKGDAPLAKGLADSITREVRETTEAMQEVQRALRQRKQITAGFPSGQAGEAWAARLEEAETQSNAGEWTFAAEALRTLTSDLQAFQVQMSEADELLSFVQEEWIALRRRLDSSNIKADDSDRIAAENAVKTAADAYEAGDVQSCLAALGRADELIENLRRRV